MVNSWIAHIKSVAKAKGIKYNEAMKIAGKTYKGAKSEAPKKGKKAKGKKAKDDDMEEMEDEPKKKKRGRPKKK